MSSGLRESGIGWVGKIPDHWETARVCVVSRLESGHTPSRQHPEYWRPEECTIPWFSLADVWQLREANRIYLEETVESISPIGLANSAARLLPAGTVILSRTASVGFSGIIRVPMATTQDFVNWICGPRLLNRYLLWAFRAMKGEFARMMMGSTHQTIYMPDVRRLAIPLPPLPEQHAIADFLDRKTAAIDNVLYLKSQEARLLEERLQVEIDVAVCGGVTRVGCVVNTGMPHLDRIPSTWRIGSLGRYIVSTCDGPFGSDMKSSHYSESGVRLIRLQNIGTGAFKDADKAFVSEEYFRSLGGHDAVSGDLLVAGLGDENHPVGRACVLPSDVPLAMVKADCFRLRLRQDRLLHDFVAWFLASTPARWEVKQQERGATRSRMNLSGVRQLRVPVAPLEDQHEIARCLDSAMSRTRRLQQAIEDSIRVLRKRREALIIAAITGRIDVRTGKEIA